MHPALLEKIEDLERIISKSSIVVAGGLLEGITTDAVCAIAAEITKSKKIINISTSGHIYDRHPSKKGARKLKKISYKRLIKIATIGDGREPGSNFIFDIAACKIAKRSGISIHFIGESISDLDNIIAGREHGGTVIFGRD